MTNPVVILDLGWWTIDGLFPLASLARLRDHCDLRWERDEPMPQA